MDKTENRAVKSFSATRRRIQRKRGGGEKTVLELKGQEREGLNMFQ